MKTNNYLIQLIKLLLIIAIIFPIHGYSQRTDLREQSTSEFLQGTIVIKVKEAVGSFEKQEGSVSFGISSLDKSAAKFGVTKLEKRFKHKPIAKNSGLPDLSRIYRIEFPVSFDVHEVAEDFSKDPNVEYAEAIPVNYASVVPNDSLYGDQQHLPQIMAPEAWDVHKGEDGDEVIVAIIDTGVDWGHPDLTENCWQNLGEDADGDGVTIELIDGVWELDPDDVNNIDDDGNGYIDDVIGWDFWEDETIGDGSNPDPFPHTDSHGTHCAGISSGRTNNGVGISSVSYNIKYMPVKVDEGYYFIYTYDGIIYAAENGADIISNSSGGSGYSEANQEVIDYAIGLGSIVIGAAGNYGIDDVFYPGAYLGVISVAALNPDDTKANFSNYGAWVDIAAPGRSILSTTIDESYDYYDGTSMATPMVAGLFGLVKSYYPDWSNDDLITQVLGSADNINAENPGFENMVGTGRINAYHALVDENVEVPEGLRLQLLDLTLKDENNNDVFEPGETVLVSFTMQNFSTIVGDTNVIITMSSTDPDISFASNSISINIPIEGQFGEENAFEFNISESAITHLAGLKIKVLSQQEIIVGGSIETSIVVAPSGFFVWEGDEYAPDYSGEFIRDFLTERGYPVLYSSEYPRNFTGFDAVFLSFGNWESGSTRLSNSMSPLISDYLQFGGYVYLEGGDALGFDQADNPWLLYFFGLASAEDGEANPIDELTGNTEALTRDMIFKGNSQVSNSYIDILVPSDAGIDAFNELDYGSVAVQKSSEDGYRSFGFTYALSRLIDNTPHSSRYNFLVKLLDFFGESEGEGYVIANFASDHTEIELGEEVQFNDWSIADSTTEITSWAWDLDGDGEIDSYDQNPSRTYNEGGVFDVTLIVSGDSDTDTLVRKDYLTVRSGILVYEGMPNENGYSGTFIHDYLESQWYEEVGYTNVFPNTLEGYDAVFLSFGNKGHNRTSVTSTMYNRIIDFCMEGGKVYIEGGDAMFYSPDELRQMVGLVGVADGEENILSNMSGKSGSLAEGLQFNHSNQFSFESIDSYELSSEFPGGDIAFEESDYGPVAIQFDGTQMFGQKSFCMSYALADLVDGTGSNTRNELLTRILNFFDVVADVEELERTAKNDLKVYPNPTSDQLTISGLPINSEFQLTDLTGNILMRYRATNNSTTINLSEFPKGIYFIRTKSGVKKIVKM